MTFALSDVVVLLILALVIGQFWRIRAITEAANRYMRHYCEQHSLQFIALARHKTRLRVYQGRLTWYNEFLFDFSGNGEDASQGTLVMLGNKVLRTDLPAYRIS
ncbi:DUF3301 domain-containing protein [Aestuariibacter halophilus]|uniref:DUF3301 domain-containing protein n=1 Tax=Fluctibacter halophilus TaxID=226011 RepID=A0ABS8GCM6_9ALTE|nr:DUF3301 domain-containing protein [Aestuariibacter halophilus]MCC2618154.1 DUF3301 domain-containing protein [Aestuariibacter halophilus]